MAHGKNASNKGNKIGRDYWSKFYGPKNYGCVGDNNRFEKRQAHKRKRREFKMQWYREVQNEQM